MSSFNRRIFLLSAVALTGCGFTPSYGPSASGVALPGNIAVDEPQSHFDYLLTRELESLLGRPAAGAKYALSISVTTDRQGKARTIDGRINRYDLIGVATYALRDTRSNEVVTSGKVENFTSYSGTGSTVATLASEADAEERLMRIFAERIRQELLAWAATAKA